MERPPPFSSSRHDRSDEKLRRIEERRKEDSLAAKQEAEQWGKNAHGGDHARIIENEASTSHFIRHADDPTLNQRKQKESRWDDPARHFVESMKQERPKYRAPPNRFDIPPGVHWDGVDRSNGFERRLFQERASKISTKEHAHRHDYEDL